MPEKTPNHRDIWRRLFKKEFEEKEIAEQQKKSEKEFLEEGKLLIMSILSFMFGIGLLPLIVIINIEIGKIDFDIVLLWISTAIFSITFFAVFPLYIQTKKNSMPKQYKLLIIFLIIGYVVLTILAAIFI